MRSELKCWFPGWSTRRSSSVGQVSEQKSAFDCGPCSENSDYEFEGRAQPLPDIELSEPQQILNSECWALLNTRLQEAEDGNGGWQFLQEFGELRRDGSGGSSNNHLNMENA